MRCFAAKKGQDIGKKKKKMRHREREEKVQDIAREKKGTRHKEREQ